MPVPDPDEDVGAVGDPLLDVGVPTGVDAGSDAGDDTGLDAGVDTGLVTGLEAGLATVGEVGLVGDAYVQVCTDGQHSKSYQYQK